MEGTSGLATWYMDDIRSFSSNECNYWPKKKDWKRWNARHAWWEEEVRGAMITTLWSWILSFPALWVSDVLVFLLSLLIMFSFFNVNFQSHWFIWWWLDLCGGCDIASWAWPTSLALSTGVYTSMHARNNCLGHCGCAVPLVSHVSSWKEVGTMYLLPRVRLLSKGKATHQQIYVNIIAMVYIFLKFCYSYLNLIYLYI